MKNEIRKNNEKEIEDIAKLIQNDTNLDPCLKQ